MKKYAILTFMGKGMMHGTAPDETWGARLNEGTFKSLQKDKNGAAQDLIRNENGAVMQFNSQVHALNYCIEQGWNLEQTLFESHEGFNSRDPLSTFIFMLYKVV
ncbi:hypothetical protein [Winogradskyella sp. SM1960]|uniref:hypothetical protein n=1 Tax=Winogradskyella sp. SM1960 TaxID=2865955 RepID=UPI001CD20C14|nr:hypothetical protein [Winogradskyella sp. SM1960]